MSDIRIDDDGAIRLLRDIGAWMDNPEKTLAKVASFAMSQILERTAAGKDVDGRAFHPYSENHKEIRQAAGRPTSKVDLFFEGDMLGSMDVSADKNKAEIYFARPEEAQKAYENQVILGREFFGIPKEDREVMAEMILEEILGR